MTPPKNIILDFDGTITTKDTISILSNFALTHKAQQGHDIQEPWSAILSSYTQDHQTHNTSYQPPLSSRLTLHQEIVYLRSLKDVEEQSFIRVGDSGVFKNISISAWRKAGKDAVNTGQVTVRPGFRDFIEEMKKQGGKVGVVSVNFAQPFICGVIEASIGNAVDGIEIIANTTKEDGVIYGPEFNKAMATSDAKLAAMRRLLESWDGMAKVEEQRAKAVYVGDSGTDLECLTADGVVGIVMCDNGKSSLMETLDRIGLKVRKCDGQERRTMSWEEVLQALETLRLYEMQQPNGSRKTLDIIDKMEEEHWDRRAQSQRTTDVLDDGKKETQTLLWASDFNDISKFLSLSTSPDTRRNGNL